MGTIHHPTALQRHPPQQPCLSGVRFRQLDRQTDGYHNSPKHSCCFFIEIIVIQIYITLIPDTAVWGPRSETPSPFLIPSYTTPKRTNDFTIFEKVDFYFSRKNHILTHTHSWSTRRRSGEEKLQHQKPRGDSKLRQTERQNPRKYTVKTKVSFFLSMIPTSELSKQTYPYHANQQRRQPRPVVRSRGSGLEC